MLSMPSLYTLLDLWAGKANLSFRIGAYEVLMSTAEQAWADAAMTQNRCPCTARMIRRSSTSSLGRVSPRRAAAAGVTTTSRRPTTRPLLSCCLLGSVVKPLPVYPAGVWFDPARVHLQFLNSRNVFDWLDLGSIPARVRRKNFDFPLRAARARTRGTIGSDV